MKKSTILFLTCLLYAFSINAQEHIEKKYTLFFRVGKSEIDRSYKNNGKTIETMLSDIKTTLKADRTVPNNILIYASTSPEGGIAINNRLAAERSKYSKRLLMDFFPQFKEENIKVEARMNDLSGVILVLKRDTSILYRNEILNVLSNPNIQDKEAALRSNPAIFNVLKEVMFDNMRTASITITVARTATNVDEFVQTPELFLITKSPYRFPAEGGNGIITYEKSVQDNTAPKATCNKEWLGSIVPDTQKATFKVEPNEATTPRTAIIQLEYYGKTYEVELIQEAAQPKVVEPEPEPTPAPVEPKPEEKKPFFFTLKTNGLYWLALTPNIGIEFYLGRRWSISADWQYAWWKTDKYEKYWRNYGGDLAIRKWFGEKSKEAPLTGHHIGVYGQIITYDFLLNNKGYLADKWSYSAGIEYGYSLPIAKRLNLDLVIGVGYHSGEYKEYTPIDGHYVWQATKNRTYIGPTKLEASIVWLIGNSDLFKMKGKK